MLKNGGSLCLCRDYKQTVNQSTVPDKYLLPKVDNLLASLAGGKSFAKFDLAHAYQQLVLDKESTKLTTTNTHRDLFRYKRLPFGISAAPAIFQCTMESPLQSIPEVCVYIDDVLVTGTTEEDHLTNLTEVLRCMSATGMRLKRKQCAFMILRSTTLDTPYRAKASNQRRKRFVPSEMHQCPQTFTSSSRSWVYSDYMLSVCRICRLFSQHCIFCCRRIDPGCGVPNNRDRFSE